MTIDANDPEVIELRTRVARLERRVEILTATVRLLLVLVRTTEASLAAARVPSAASKARVLRAIAAAAPKIGRRAALRVIGLSENRLREWTARAKQCALEDAPPCPRSVPGRLTTKERQTIRDMVEAEDYKHLSLRSLALLGQRLGHVFAAYETWCRLVRAHGWRRPRRRLYPEKPKIGIRSERPNEWWHVDVTVIRLLDGTRTFLHAVVDNYSRRVLGWTLEHRLSAGATRRILHEATTKIAERTPPINVMTDGGPENLVFGGDGTRERREVGGRSGRRRAIELDGRSGVESAPTSLALPSHAGLVLRRGATRCEVFRGPQRLHPESGARRPTCSTDFEPITQQLVSAALTRTSNERVIFAALWKRQQPRDGRRPTTEHPGRALARESAWEALTGRCPPLGRERVPLRSRAQPNMPKTLRLDRDQRAQVTRFDELEFYYLRPDGSRWR